ncbi:unnamed protein product [Rhizoctonia solani]|uniref:Uncharacterized protein n=1 Tax=Rhizoctonia solani TaxID=456999 RepID=A0A8H2WVE5_9AGAM|nr:unnamed protein product [Rhizoctonia solani]
MAAPFTTSSVTLRARSASDASDIGPTARARIIAESALPPCPSPHLDVPPIQHRRGALNTWAAFFTTKSERKKSAAIFDTTGAPPEPAPPDDPPPKQPTTIRLPKVARKRISSPPPANPSATLGRSFTGRPRPLSRIEGSPANSPTFPEVFASLPAKTRERIRSSYDSTRRSHERPEFFTLGRVCPTPEIPDPDTPTPTSYSVRASTESRSSTHIKRRTMASLARSPITSAHSARRISALPLGDDLCEAGEFYRASTADLSDFLRKTGPEDSNPAVPVGKPQTKDVDKDGANSIRSRTRSSIFRIGGRKREKSRHNTDRAVHTDDAPPLPVPALPHLPVQDDRSFSPILPMLNLNDDSAEQSARSSLQSTHYSNGRLPPNTREHRLRDGTTILMITTPQPSPEAKVLSHSRSLGSMTTASKDEAGQRSVGTSHRVESTMLQSQPYSPVSYANTTSPEHKFHSPTVSMSSDGTLATSERQRTPSAEGLALLSRIKALESTVTPQTSPSQLVPGRSISMGAHGGYLQVQTPKTRPRGYSTPEPVSPPSTESTPTVSTPLPTFSPSASIAPTPELTPQKSPLTLPESIPVVTVVPPRKHSPASPIIVDGLHFPAPPNSSPRARRRPNTMESPPLGYTPASPSRTSKSMKITRNPRNSGLSEADSIKARTKKFDSRPSPLNLDAVPTYRHWKSNPVEVHIQPGELTGLELDLNSEQPTETGKKRQSLMEQHQQLFLNANPFQTPPSPSEPFLGSPLKAVARLPLESGPPAMPLPPSPRPFPDVSMSATSPISLRSSVLPNELRHSTPNSQRTRFDSLMIRPPALITAIPSSPVTSDATHALTNILTAQREQFDGMNKYLIDMVKSFEEEKRAYEQRIQELMAAVNEKEAKAKEDERKIKGLEWLVGNLNLRAGGGKASNGEPPSDSGSNDPKISRRRGSFSGLGAKEDIPMAPLPIDRALDPVERAKRAASMDDVLQNLIALSESGRFNSVRSHPNIYEWAANTALEQD